MNIRNAMHMAAPAGMDTANVVTHADDVRTYKYIHNNVGLLSLLDQVG